MKSLKSHLKKLIQHHTLWVILIFGISFLMLLPFFIRPYYAGHDTKFHFANILSIENQILSGNISTDLILDKISYGLGYGTRLFYPPLSHTVTAYVGAFLSFFHFTIFDTLKLVHFVVLFLSGVTMYFLSYRFSKSKIIAFFSAIIYMGFPYHISDIYVRDSLAECFLYPFLPMILSGVYELLQGNLLKFYPLFIIGYVGGILSHFTLMLYFTLLLMIFLLVSRKKFFQKKVFVPFTFACISILGISLSFLSTILENRVFADYVVFEPGEMTKRIYKTALYPFEYLNIFPFLQSHIKFYYPVVILLFLIIVFLKRKKIKFPKYTKNFLVFGAVAFFLSTKLFPWNVIPSIFQMIQFPWRFEIFIAIVVSLIAPLWLSIYSKKSMLVVFVIFLLFSSYHAISIPSEEIMSLENIWWNGGMGWQKEYLPISAKENIDYLKKKKQTIAFVMGDGKTQILENNFPNLTFQLKIEDSSIIELPRIYYPGYQLVTEDGKRQPLEMSKYGLIQAKVSKSTQYFLEYTGTTLVRVSKKISIFTLIISIFSYLYYYRYRKRSS